MVAAASLTTPHPLPLGQLFSAAYAMRAAVDAVAFASEDKSRAVARGVEERQFLARIAMLGLLGGRV